MNWFCVGLGDGKLVLPIEGIGSASEDWNRCELQVGQSWGAPGGTWLEWIKYPISTLMGVFHCNLCTESAGPGGMLCSRLFQGQCSSVLCSRSARL